MKAPPLTITQVAIITGHTRTRVSQWAKEGTGPPRDEKTVTYPVVEFGRWFRSQFAGPNHKDRLVEMQADKAEMEVKELRGVLAPVDDMLALMLDKVDKFRKRMLLLPNAAATQLVPASQVAEARSLLTTLVHEALAELSTGKVGKRLN